MVVVLVRQYHQWYAFRKSVAATVNMVMDAEGALRHVRVRQLAVEVAHFKIPYTCIRLKLNRILLFIFQAYHGIFQ